MKDIVELIDIALQKWIESGINSIPGDVPENMRTGKTEDDWIEWVPVQSNVSDSDIDKLEKNLEVVIPTELREIIKHKHFMELYIGEVELYALPSDGWQKSISDGIYDTWPREYLIDKGFMPFANYSDWGLWCFNLNEKSESDTYPIYLWDHEEPNKHTFVANTLKEALNEEYKKA